MKHLIIEKEYSYVIFMDSNTVEKLCDIVDIIEESFPETVIEITHNRNTKQGSIILKKESPEFSEKIRGLLDTDNNQKSDFTNSNELT